MTWTYGNDPANDPVDEVRLLVSDTDSSDPLISDEEIAYFIAKGGTGVGAAYLAANAIAAKFGRLADEKTGMVEVKWHQRYKAYSQLAADLKRQLVLQSVPVPFGGGISITDIENRRDDTDRLAEVFRLGMNDGQVQ